MSGIYQGVISKCPARGELSNKPFGRLVIVSFCINFSARARVDRSPELQVLLIVKYCVGGLLERVRIEVTFSSSVNYLPTERLIMSNREKVCINRGPPPRYIRSIPFHSR